MSILKIHIRNCYGIGSFDKEFDLTKGSGIIYAPNGTMKSSLTHVFQDIVSGIDSCDRIYTERISEREVLMDNNPIDARGSGSTRAREFHPHPLTEPCVKVSPHTALHTQLFVHRHNLGV